MNPIRRISLNDPMSKSSGSQRTRGITPSVTTAAKVSQIQLPNIGVKTGLRGRQISRLEDADQLSKEIKGDWNLLEPEELAEKIVELEKKVSLLNEVGPEVDKIKRQAEHLHFKFVFPVALELESSQPMTFAREIYQAANRVFKSHSLKAFEALNQTQKLEVMKIAGRSE